MAILFALVATGCASLLANHPTPTSPVLQISGVTTNDVNLVAYLKAAEAVNQAVDVTPANGSVGLLLAAATALASAAAGWYARHSSARAATEATEAVLTSMKLPKNPG
jgi:hypothetical protein